VRFRLSGPFPVAQALSIDEMDSKEEIKEVLMPGYTFSGTLLGFSFDIFFMTFKL